MKPTDSETSIIFSSICQKNRDQRLILSKEAGSSVQRPASPIHMLIWLEKTTCFQANQQEFPVDWDANLIGRDPWWLGANQKECFISCRGIEDVNTKDLLA